MAGHDRGLRAAQRRLQGADAGIQRPRRAAATGRSTAATPIPSSAASRSMPVRQGPLHQSRAVAHSLSPPRHAALLQAAQRAARAFVQVNYNAYLHTSQAFGGKPQRYREIQADFYGHVAELLAKATRQSKLDEAVSKEDQEGLLEALRRLGRARPELRLCDERASSDRRGYDKEPGGGLSARPMPSDPMASASCSSRACGWRSPPGTFDMQTTLFQPVGGMGLIGEAFGRELGDADPVQRQGHRDQPGRQGVTVSLRGHREPAAAGRTAPGAIGACAPFRLDPGADPDECRARRWPRRSTRVPYAAAIKVGLQFKRRFWEEDESHLWRHHLYRPADRQYRLSQYRLSQRRQGRAAGRLYLGPERHGVHRDDARGARAESGRVRQPDPSAISRRSSRTASRSRGTARRSRWAARHVDRGDARASTTTICARSTGASCWRASTPRSSAGWQEGAVTSALDAIDGCITRAWRKLCELMRRENC